MASEIADEKGPGGLQSTRGIIESIKLERSRLLEQIAESKKTIARSYALIEHLDAVLAKAQKE
ncbi:MAG TPA: hypothetical protein VFL51_17420 [Pseudolabrys sp.]|nr:hypothetical protein [Pseudolabrys sp.]